MHKYKGEIGLLLVTLVWGVGFPATNIALQSADVHQILFLRFVIGTVLLSLIFIKKFKLMNKLNLQSGIILGTILYVAFFAQTTGQSMTTPSKTAFLTTTNVVMVPLIGFFFYREKLDRYATFGAIMAFVGATVMSFNLDLSVNFGDLLVLVGALFYACHVYFTGRFLQKGADAILITIVQIITTTVFAFVAMIVMGSGDLSQIKTEGFLAILFMGVASTTFAFLLQTISQKYVSQTKAVVIMSMESVFGTISSVLILSEVIGFRMALGSLIILFGVFVSELGSKVVANFSIKKGV